MSGTVNRLIKQGHIKDQPSFIEDNIHLEGITGSTAYGCNNPDKADFDIYSICIPSKEILFPHTAGVIQGYDENFKKFQSYQKHHIAVDKKEYDINVYNIADFFRLAVNGNPNIIDFLFIPANCITHMTAVGTKIRENRKLFLSKKVWHTYKGFAFSQMAALKGGRKTTSSKRKDDIEEKGYDTKYAYHTIRLLNQVEQAMLEGDMDLQRNREQLKSIRRGEWKVEDILNYFTTKERELETIYLESNVLPHKARYEEVKQLLVECLEMHFGDISTLIKVEYKQDKHLKGLSDIKKIVDGLV